MNSNPLRTTSQFSPPEFSRCMLICDWEKKYALESPALMNTNPSMGELLGFLDLEKTRSCLEEHK